MKFLIAIFLFLPITLFAQTFPYSSDASERAVNSIEDITASIISDSFSPMTHYSAGNTIYSAVPAYFKADTLMENPDIKGDNFKGYAFGAGAGHAVTDDLMFYFTASGIKMKGDMKYAGYGEQFGIVKNSADFSLISVLGGCGYDLIDDNIFSIPVYFGGNIQYYSAEISSEQISWTDTFTYDVNMKTYGSGFLAGVSGGIAVSAKIYDKFKITPYFLYIRNINGTEMKSKIKIQNTITPIPEVSTEYKFDVDPVSAGMAGLNIGYFDQSGFSVSLAWGGLISSLTGYGSKASSNGVEMKSVVMIFSYNK